MKYSLDKFEQPSFRVSVENSSHESFFVAKKRATGLFTVFGPTEDCTPENMDFADVFNSRDERTANEFCAVSSVRRAIYIAKEAAL